MDAPVDARTHNVADLLGSVYARSRRPTARPRAPGDDRNLSTGDGGDAAALSQIRNEASAHRVCDGAHPDLPGMQAQHDAYMTLLKKRALRSSILTRSARVGRSPATPGTPAWRSRVARGERLEPAEAFCWRTASSTRSAILPRSLRTLFWRQITPVDEGFRRAQRTTKNLRTDSPAG